MAENDVTKSPNIPSITILDSDDEQEQTTDELFEGFVKAVKPFLERKELLLLRVKFQAVSSDFKCSPRFKDMLRRKANQVHKVDVYIHFNEVLDAIIHNAAVYGNKRQKKTQDTDLSGDDTGNSSVSQDEGGQMPRHEILAGNFESTNEANANNSTSLNQSSESADNDVQFVEETVPGNSSSSGGFQNPKISNNKRDIEKERMKMKRKKLITKLEEKLKYISDEIKKFSQSELSLDEMDDGNSSYIMESRLKKRFNTTWNKICKLKGRPTNTGRVVEGSIKCKSSGFPAIDRAIAKFLKKKKGFPDIFDIRNIVMRVNKKRGLGLTQVVQNDIAADILTDIGNKLQKKRKKDFEYNFGCHLTDDCLPSLDPALHNPNLLQKLEENKRVNQNALESVFQKYVHLGRVKGPRNHGTDSNTTSESNSETEQESTRQGKRKAKKESESSSENYSEEESPKKKFKKMKNFSKNKKAKISVVMSEASATDMSSPTRSSSVEDKNSDSKDENNSNEEQAMIIDDEILGTEVEKPGSLEFEEPQNKSESEQGASQDVSVVNEAIKKMKDAPLASNASGSARGEPHIQVSSPQRTESNGNVKAAHGQRNGFAPGDDNDEIKIINNGEDSVKSLNAREEIETVKNLPKQKPSISTTKLLVKIQELRENQLSRFNVYNSYTNSSISGENRKVESCHSKRKATSVRHITHNQDYLHSSLSNGHRNNQVQDSNKNKEQRSKSVLNAPSASKTRDLSPQKQTPSFQESIKHSPSANLKNLLSQNSIHTGEQNPRISYIPEQRSSSPKARLSTVSSQVVNGKVPKLVETVIILSDDEDD